MHKQRLFHNLAHAHQRVQRFIRILKNHLHLAAQCMQLRLVAALHWLAGKKDSAARGGLQSDDGERERGLAAAAFAHQRQHLAALQLQADAVQRTHNRLRLKPARGPGRKVLVQCAHFQQRNVHAGCGCGLPAGSAGCSKWQLA